MSPRQFAPVPTPVPDETPGAVETPQDAPATQEPPQDDQDDDEPPTDDDPADDEPSGNREAAKYRRRLRDTEAERDSLRDQVAAMQRAEAERIAGRNLTKPAAMWAAGVSLPDLLAEDGTVDPTKVDQAVIRAADELGLSRPTGPGYVPTQGTGSKRPPPPPVDEAMSAIVQGRR